MLLVRDDVLRARASVASAELAPLADGLIGELAPVIGRELYIPREKALLSREGGRCPRDGATLEFDPFSPHHHRCPTCGKIYTGILHDRFWVFWYQLWLAERAVHGALLANLRVDDAAGTFAERVLDRYADEYLLYANRDNVLGPTRPFFSTYLESIWLLNLCIATDLLEKWRPQYATLGARVRERIVEPSVELITSYDEGASNRQVWNDAAMLAASFLLDRTELGERALFGPSGITHHLAKGLLADGTWYEGENYHLFAHRGLWYGVTIAEANEVELPHDLVARFHEAFATPFLSALPDMTLPSRRDSQYAISLRQSRFAELCELGLARHSHKGDARLCGVLYHLYEDDVPRHATGRAQSTADVERNLPGTHLSRADLGWRSLLFARPMLPPLDAEPLGSVLLEAQGLAVFRREQERIYVALDYGASGGGHGHPDRLNVLLSDGATRWLDDMGTGSYVDPSLHWYRSTLAHNAPLFDGYRQLPIDGELIAFDEQAGAGWISARAFDLFPGVAAMRTVVVMTDYVLDELLWSGAHVLDLPMHIEPAVLTIHRSASGGADPYSLTDALEDTLGVISDVSAKPLEARSVARFGARDGFRILQGLLMCSHDAVLYRVSAPGPPGHPPHPFLILRAVAMQQPGWLRTIWSWRDEVETIWTDPGGRITTVERRDASHDRHRHTLRGWRVEQVSGDRRRVIELGGVVRRRRSERAHRVDVASPVFATLRIGEARVFDLGEHDYRRSEETWDEAGRPTARLTIVPAHNELIVEVKIRKVGGLTFVPHAAVNPYDNEHADINGDGVQFYFADADGASAWLLVPESTSEQGRVHCREIEHWDSPRELRASWSRVVDGYTVHIAVPVTTATEDAELKLGVVVNEKPVGRERRRGQLVLGGAGGEFVYLRGDREDLDRLPRFKIVR